MARGLLRIAATLRIATLPASALPMSVQVKIGMD
jgi:hypothetical protein